MNDTRNQDLTEIFANIIKMMLQAIRAHGLRSLRHLPMLFLVGMQLRRFGKEFAAVMAALEAGTLPVPASALGTAPQDRQAACAQPEGMRRVASRPDAGDHRQQALAVNPVVPDGDAGPDRARAADAARPAPDVLDAGGEAAALSAIAAAAEAPPGSRDRGEAQANPARACGRGRQPPPNRIGYGRPQWPPNPKLACARDGLVRANCSGLATCGGGGR